MLSNLKIAAILSIGVLTTSLLLFPEPGNIQDTPLARSLKKVEAHVDEIKLAKKQPMAVWREFQAALLEEFTTINVGELSEEEVNFMFNKLKNLALPIIKSVMTQGAKNLNNFSDYEKYLLFELVCSSMKMVKKGSIAYRFMNHMRKKLDSCQMSPIEYLKGDCEETIPSNQVKFFSWNTCMLPGSLAKAHAGLESWVLRFSQIVGIVEEQNADIVCLQEVYSESAALKLYEKLKDRYAHFYINMGPKVMGSKMSEVGLNSGLFVASKIPLENPYFESFKSTKPVSQINKGFFSSKIGDNHMSFVTCHLEPFDDMMSQEERKNQLSYVIDHMKKLPAEIKILTGDLNIPYGNLEPAESVLRTYFYDPYNKNRHEVTKYSRTYSDHFLTQKSEGSDIILDYFLILQEPGYEKYAYVIERVEGFNEVSMESKGSDHHGLFSQIVFPYIEK